MITKLASTQLVDMMREKLQAKYPNAWDISVSAMQGGPYARVETDDEWISYSFDATNKLRVSSRKTINPTYKSVRLEPKDSVVMIKGGKYDGHYIVKCEGEGYFKTSTNVADARPKAKYDADNFRNYCAFHTQYRYVGEVGRFVVVNINSNN